MFSGTLSLDLDEDLRLFGRVPFSEGPQAVMIGRLLLLVRVGFSDAAFGNLLSSFEVVILLVVTVGPIVGGTPPLETSVFFPFAFS